VGAKEGGRISRMTKTVNCVYKKAKKLDAEIYHLHDPELIPIGIKLKKLGKKVIFDAHEDFSKQILGKPYLNILLKLTLSKIITLYESWAYPKFDAIIAATPYIRDKFLQSNPNTLDVNNFPILDELANNTEWALKLNEVAYVGGIARIRGVEEIVEAMNYTQGVRLNLGGQFNEKTIEAKVKKYHAWSKVNELGFLDRNQVNEVLAKSTAGLVTLHPIINYIDSLPVKMFEYMAAGIPVISSNFPGFRGIVEGNHCGMCVDPLNSQAIGKAIQYLIDHPEEAERMGKNGRKSVEDKYNWAIEENKLLNLYESLSC
jgi:glycosyltransferase involved in cell wall biosynthesis